MASAAILPPTTETPLSRDHYFELEAAKPRFKKVRAAARVAAFNGWTLAILAVLSLPFALFSVEGMLMAAALSVIAYIEFRGRRGLLQFNPSASTLLGWNQVGLLTLIVGYCLWQLWAGLSGPSPMTAELKAQPELGEALGSLDDVEFLYKGVVLAFYGTIIALSVVVQGLNAFYYFTRHKHVVACLQDTPEWVLDLERRASRN
jgi:hypothetical protein